MEPRGIFSMAVPAEVLAAALAEDGSRRSRPGAVPDYICFTVDGRRMLYDVKRISFCPTRYWPTVAVASSRGSYGVRGGSLRARCPDSGLVHSDGDRRPSRSSVHRQALGPHTPVHLIGRDRVDADTTQRRPTRVPTKGRPRTPIPHRSLSNRASSTRDPSALERRPRPEDSCDLPQSNPRDAEVGGWASRD